MLMLFSPRVGKLSAGARWAGGSLSAAASGEASHARARLPDPIGTNTEVIFSATHKYA